MRTAMEGTRGHFRRERCDPSFIYLRHLEIVDKRMRYASVEWQHATPESVVVGRDIESFARHCCHLESASPVRARAVQYLTRKRACA